jgi:CPA2 family monovalent cation:H+ antiporter-2
MDSWSVLYQILVLLGAATLLGLAVQRFGQNAIIGYLLAGVLVGPSALGIVESSSAVAMLAELGVALLLFTIGLEFSLKSLRALGGTVALLGVMQIVVTTAAAAGLAQYLGLDSRQAIIAGIAIAMSSTSVVMRLLSERSELDSSHGRSTVGILLLQDLAIIPAMLMITAMGQAQGGMGQVRQFFLSLVSALGLMLGVYVLIRWVFPALMMGAAARRNREIPILLSITICLGCSWAGHALGLSPVLGSFAAGILLAESPFADQVRADVVPLRSAFLTLFFGSIGMFAVFPGVDELPGQVALIGGIIALKAGLIVLLSLTVRRSLTTAVRTSLSLAQIGEFSFVLLDIAFREGLMPAGIFQPLLVCSVVTLLATPLIIAHSETIANTVVAVVSKFVPVLPAPAPSPAEARKNHVIVIGFGPAGRQVVEQLRFHGASVLVMELNPAISADEAEGISLQFGDATQPEMIQHASPQEARAVVVTIPDPRAAALIISHVRGIAPEVPVITRVRYHMFKEQLAEAGSRHLVDEEVLVGHELARQTLGVLT